VKYKDGNAFRRALEARLRSRSLETGEPLIRLRKMVAFDRFLARLADATPSSWVLKGGYALQLRLGEKARTTKDIDLLMRDATEDAHDLLITAASKDLEDWFSFEVGRASESEAGDPHGGARFPVRSMLDGRTFEGFHVDVGVGDPIVGQIEDLTGPSLLGFGGIEPNSFPSYPISQQLAEKIHAFTRVYETGATTRVRDLVDILLIGMTSELLANELTKALDAVFSARLTHYLPTHLPDPPSQWARSYTRLRRDLDVPWPDLDAAIDAERQFIEPILNKEARGRWRPGEWKWE
jgi:hypothetical protein